MGLSLVWVSSFRAEAGAVSQGERQKSVLVSGKVVCARVDYSKSVLGV